LIDIEAKMKGFEEAEKRPEDFPFAVRKRVIKGSLRRGAMAIQRGAKANAPTRSGSLKRSIRVRVGRSLVAQVYADQSGGWYAHMIERGVQAHSVARGASVRRNKLQNKGIMHPGFKGSRFMEKASESESGAAINAFADRFEQLLIKELNR